MEEKDIYLCTCCGACCMELHKKIGDIDKEHFPYKWDKNGRCEMLSEDNKCKIYSNRPPYCYISTLPSEKFSRQIAESCNEMIDRTGIPDSFKIKI